jgi:hypothetical protein
VKIIFRERLDPVMLLAHRLPVGLVPKQALVSPVRLDVINDCGTHSAHCAIRVLLKEFT